MILHADVLKWLRAEQWQVQHGYLPKAHAVFADPPYFLGSIAKRFGGKQAAPAQFGRDGAFQRQSRGFMGQTWDGFNDVWEYQAWVTEWASLLIDFVHPGAVLAMFGGTRTYHRLAAGLEDAGWEVFDCLMYVYGSGFPKAADIGKLIDKAEGAEREVVGVNPNHRPISGVEYDGIYRGGNTGAPMISAAASPNAQRFDGYKTALKPAYEPLVLARAPRGKATYAELAQRYGTGAINVDAGRVRTNGECFQRPVNHTNLHEGWSRPWMQEDEALERERVARDISQSKAEELGRYPANLILDECAAAMMDEQSGDRKAGGNLSGSEPSSKTSGIYNGGFNRDHQWSSYDDSGGASRFFYTAKAPAWEREAGLSDFTQQTVTDGRETPIDNAYQRGETKRRNIHPTVKPIQLTEYITRLLLPPVLDVPRRLLVPFAGVGSEMIGATLAGWDEVVGIEMTAEYIPINEARRRWWGQFKTYEQAQMAYRPPVALVDDYAGLPLFAAE